MPFNEEVIIGASYLISTISILLQSLLHEAWQDDPAVHKGTLFQVWGPKFNPWAPHSERGEMTLESPDCHMHAMAHVQTCAHTTVSINKTLKCTC